VLKVIPGGGEPLFDVAATRRLEGLEAADLPPHALMRRAGLAVARLALALTPHSHRIWIACGPGNNGGDGMEAAVVLHQWGKQPWVTWAGCAERCPPDAAASLARMRDAGIAIQPCAPDHADLCIDALLGIGGTAREPEGALADTIRQINASTALKLAVDVPSGLNADTGQVCRLGVQTQHCLSLLTLKPGLFTANGRDAVGTVWFDALGVSDAFFSSVLPVARLPGIPPLRQRKHASHKGSYGDVAVIGGAAGMTGAALLTASAALHAGSGRVFVALLDTAALSCNTSLPEIMFRSLDSLNLDQMVTVFGCGGGNLSTDLIDRVLSSQSPVVIDADAINSIATSSTLQNLMMMRGHQHRTTVLTPHPLEAARLLGVTTPQIQADRLAAANTLSQRYACTVAIKGSGTVICTPGQTPVINLTGNGRLATAGSGDVLAGMIGAALAQGEAPFEATCKAVFFHGGTADGWPADQSLTAARLARSISVNQ